MTHKLAAARPILPVGYADRVTLTTARRAHADGGTVLVSKTDTDALPVGPSSLAHTRDTTPWDELAAMAGDGPVYWYVFGPVPDGNPTTWADGYGVWHAVVDVGPNAARHAAAAIRHELDIRGDRGKGYRVRVTPDGYASGSLATRRRYVETVPR